MILLDLFAGFEAVADQLGGVEPVLPSQARSDATAEIVRAFGQRLNARGEHPCLRHVIPLLHGQPGNLLGGGAQLELRATAQEVTGLAVQQRYHMAQARVLTARIQALAKRADNLRGRVGASLRGKYGFDSPELIRYGFKPRKQVKQDQADRELEGERKARAAEETEE